jgi:uncharacterized protein (DUF952 family)
VKTIFHIAERSFWEAAQLSGQYRNPGLDAEGFIHLSTSKQYVLTANRYYRGRTDLVLLEVNEDELQDLRYEVSTNEELFPHLYGTIPVDAVVAAHPFLPASNGDFE